MLILLNQDYCYCVFCMKNWHGNMNPCSLPQSSAIVSRFLAGTPAEQASLEQRYGAANIKRLVAVLEEERVNREWFEANSTDCPCCLIKVEKSEGCSHMQCPRCGTHFCFRCGDKLSALDPCVLIFLSPTPSSSTCAAPLSTSLHIPPLGSTLTF